MTGLILRLLLGGFLIAHGLLHWHFDISRSWLLRGTGLVKSQPVRSSAALLWILASTGFFVTGLSLMGFPVLHEWWRSLAITSAFVSLVLLVLAWASMVNARSSYRHRYTRSTSMGKLVTGRLTGKRLEGLKLWPGMAQMGQGRGGLHSHGWLENLRCIMILSFEARATSSGLG